MRTLYDCILEVRISYNVQKSKSKSKITQGEPENKKLLSYLLLFCLIVGHTLKDCIVVVAVVLDPPVKEIHRSDPAMFSFQLLALSLCQ